jgi:catabolite repression HPr-like protein
MLRKPITVRLFGGKEERPVAVLVQLANEFSSQIYFESDNKRVNAKSMMGMMTMAFYPGEQVVVCADGTDEQEVIDRMEHFFTAE